MPTQIEITYTRPNLDVSWGPNIKSAELEAHYKTEYIDTGMLLSENVSFSPDNLQLHRTTTWAAGVEILVKYKTDQVIQDWIQTRNAYNDTNGIIASVPFQEFLSHEDHLLESDEATGPFTKV